MLYTKAGPKAYNNNANRQNNTGGCYSNFAGVQFRLLARLSSSDAIEYAITFKYKEGS